MKQVPAVRPIVESFSVADFKKLLVWQKAHALAVNTSIVSGHLRGPAHSSLRSQLVRAAMSIDANISEGRSRPTQREFVRYLNIAISSASEVESHILMARDTRALSDADSQILMEQVVEVRRMLYGLTKHIQNTLNQKKSDS
jgi:four helix bundle protein